MKYKYLLILSFLVIGGCQTQEQKKVDTKKYRIAYNVFVDTIGDNYEIFSMNLDGSDQRNISILPGVEWTYHATGQELLYISDQDTCKRCYLLYSTNAFGEKPKKIGGYLLKDSWQSSRKNGQEIIVSPRVENDSAFYIINRSGELIEKIYTGLVYFSDPAFSPDGTQIVFRGSNERENVAVGYQDELYIMNTNGTDLKQLTYYPEEDSTANWWQYRAGPPYWESTKNIISFHSVQQGGSYLFQINPDGTEMKKLTPDSLRIGWHSWSSDGKMIAFDVETQTPDGKPNYDIFLMDYQSGEIKQLTDGLLFEQAPVFVEVD